MAASNSSEGEERQGMLRRILSTALTTALTPLRLATSRSALKAYLSTFLFLAATVILLTLSTSAYLIFYYSFVPQIGLREVAHLQYGDGPHPYANLALHSSSLSTQQPYDISLELHVPRTPANLAAGNFMLDLALLAQTRASSSSSSATAKAVVPDTSTVLAQSRRPAMLPYQSPLLTLANNMISLPLHTLGLRDLNAERLKIPMFEQLSFDKGWKNMPAAIRLKLLSEQIIQVYNAEIIFEARFQGLRYVLYNYRLLSFLVFTGCFYAVAITSTSIAWFVISSVFSASSEDKESHSTSEAFKNEGNERQEDEKLPSSNGHARQDLPSVGPTQHVKKESLSDSSTDSSLSGSSIADSASVFPTVGRRMPLRFPVHRPSDSSAGSMSGSKIIKPEPIDDEDILEAAAIEPLVDEGTVGDQKSPSKDRDAGVATSTEESARDGRNLHPRRGRNSRAGSENGDRTSVAESSR